MKGNGSFLPFIQREISPEEVRNMGNLNIGLAMVAARLATSETEKELEDRKKRESRAYYPHPGRRPVAGKPSLPGAKIEVVKGKLILIPSVEPKQ